MLVKEFYRPEPMAAGASYNVKAVHIAGFLATAAGTITVTDAAGNVLLNAMPVAVGFNPLHMLLPSSDGGVVSLGGGAAGSLLI